MIAAFFAIAATAVPPTRTAAPRDLAEAEQTLGRADAMALEPLEVFERTGRASDARAALDAARAARDLLESARVPETAGAARREELGFLNHLVLGLSAYVANPAAPRARERLRGVIRRARAHRSLGRDGRPAPAGPTPVAH